EPAVGREADAAVEGPRGAVDRGGEDVGQRAQPAAAEPRRGRLRHRGHQEEEGQVAQDDAEQRGGREAAHDSSSGGRSRRASTISTATMLAQIAKRYITSAGTPRMKTGRLAMARRGQTRHAPNNRKQATTSSAAFIGCADYSAGRALPRARRVVGPGGAISGAGPGS